MMELLEMAATIKDKDQRLRFWQSRAIGERFAACAHLSALAYGATSQEDSTSTKSQRKTIHFGTLKEPEGS